MNDKILTYLEFSNIRLSLIQQQKYIGLSKENAF